MQQLVKPSEYAKIHGLSRQSVYAKIKRGTLPSRKVDGRYYVIISDTLETDIDKNVNDEEKIEHVSFIEEYKEIIKAKDETIAVLKESIRDLKEANAQITRTLQEEIELLKQAFNEMRSIYQSQKELPASIDKSSSIDIDLHINGNDSQEKEREKEGEEECWIPLGDLIQRKKYNYNKAKQIVKRFKKAYKKGDKRIKKQNGIYFISCYDFYEDILE